jgi:hypothetical protein
MKTFILLYNIIEFLRHSEPYLHMASNQWRHSFYCRCAVAISACLQLRKDMKGAWVRINSPDMKSMPATVLMKAKDEQLEAQCVIVAGKRWTARGPLCDCSRQRRMAELCMQVATARWCIDCSNLLLCSELLQCIYCLTVTLLWSANCVHYNR